MTSTADINERSSHDDIDLTFSDIQSLSSADEVTRFFTKLQYDTGARIEQSLGAMNIDLEKLRHDVRRIERIAHNKDDFGGVFEVYLFEVRSLTNAVRNELVQQFRNRSGDFLLVLTDTTNPCERLDFVLVERYNQVITSGEETLLVQPLPGNKSSMVRPRVLQVERLKPDEVTLRVLKRFTYTEGDTIAQYEKLLNAYALATWSEPYFNNRALFSDYYLLHRLPEREEWKDPKAQSDMTRAYRQLRQMYEDAREECSGKPLITIERNVFTPVLEQLGFKVVGERSKVDDVSRDVYRLFTPDTINIKDAKPLALCIPCVWNRNLDGTDSPDKDGNLRDTQTPEENPGAFVVSLLDSGEADWAIVTNGISWRLYSAKAHSRATNYYEIFLPETLEKQRSEQAFPYFWHLFRAAAFQSATQQGEGEARSLLDDLLHESDLHARELGEKLKTRIFEEIFPSFASGFVAYARQHGMLPDDLEVRNAEERNTLLEPYFTATLTFLYRLLFLFYAESRDLLPVRQEQGYYQKSLQHLKQGIAHDAGELEDKVAERLRSYSKTDTTLYDQLRELFAAVDKGNPDLNVPVYNGGLFLTNPPSHIVGEPQELTVARFLQSHKIPDRQLALGLDRMARDVDEKLARATRAEDVNGRNHKLVFIDYKSLGVRHLGSIYEGLLEFKLRIASEEMAVITGKRTDEIVPLSELQQGNSDSKKAKKPKRVYPRGSVYLENDRHERKATGSYYTPDYIVKYIVEQTVGPILKEKLETLISVFRDAQRTLDAEQRKAKQLKSSVNPEQEAYKLYQVSLNEAFFDLKVLDPAMGSGHFLVEAVDYITDQMAKVLNRYKWSPILYELAMTRKKIQESMEQQGVSIDSGKLTDLNLLKRRVLKSCIYGVDLNPMAVELAKVSLWLDCFTLGAPLSFLDHHLKCGNSLIGADVQEVRRGITDSLFGFQFSSLLEAAQLMRGVSKRPDVTAQEVAESREVYAQADEHLAPYKRLLNVWLSEYFGNKKAQNVASDNAKAITDNAYSNLNKEDITIIKAAQPLASSKKFFHWQLEFPEVFFDETQYKEDGGFDAVIGNPPYVRQEGLGDDKNAFKALYSVFNSIADLYTYFIERSHVLLRPAARFGMITANKFMRANYGAALRSFLTTEVRLEKLIDFGELRVFGEAATDPLITISSKNTPSDSTEYVQIKNLNFNVLSDVVENNKITLSKGALSSTHWSLVADAQQMILEKLNIKAISLKEYVNGKIQYGIKTGFNEAFIIDKATRERLIAEDAKNVEIIKAFIVGDDVRRYILDTKERYIILTYVGVPIDKYPAIYKHLQLYQEKLESRWDKGNHWWELRHCDYYEDFNKPKIMYPVIAMSSRFTLDSDGYYSNDKTFIIPKNDMYLLALLNSQLIWFYLKQICSVLGDANNGGRLELRSIYIENLPIHHTKTTVPFQMRTYYHEQAKQTYDQYQSNNNQEIVLSTVEHHLSKEPEESDVVHDLLAFLAEQMLDLNKRKRAMQKEFLDWLVETLRVIPDKSGEKSGIEVLTGKGRLQEYAGDYQKGEAELKPGELWEIVRKNRSHLGVRLSLDGLEKRVLERYEASLNDVLPLKKQLQRTDELIDTIVYRLYGLTEEEIAVVEGRG